MALIKCKECSKYIQDKATECPHCKTSNVKNKSSKDKGPGSKWESIGLFMLLSGGLTFLFAEPPNAAGLVMTVSGLIVYGFGKFIIGKYI